MDLLSSSSIEGNAVRFEWAHHQQVGTVGINVRKGSDVISVTALEEECSTINDMMKS